VHHGAPSRGGEPARDGWRAVAAEVDRVPSGGLAPSRSAWPPGRRLLSSLITGCSSRDCTDGRAPGSGRSPRERAVSTADRCGPTAAGSACKPGRHSARCRGLRCDHTVRTRDGHGWPPFEHVDVPRRSLSPRSCGAEDNGSLHSICHTRYMRVVAFSAPPCDASLALSDPHCGHPAPQERRSPRAGLRAGSRAPPRRPPAGPRVEPLSCSLRSCASRTKVSLTFRLSTPFVEAPSLGAQPDSPRRRNMPACATPCRLELDMCSGAPTGAPRERRRDAGSGFSSVRSRPISAF
jgi:hypothetical protein